ncbi:MAG: LTA synthase family protein [Slackia sp.]
MCLLYDLKGADNMTRYLSSLGYKTSAIHPAESENWRRDRVYKQLGFDEFHSIESFTDAEMFRNMVSDASTYDLVLELLAQDEGPQFIFDVTIASHGGYDTGTVPEEEMAHVALDGEENAELNEYISCIERSDAELKDFMDKLRLLDRPVVLCFFGDHQPGFVEWLSSGPSGRSV